jgi:hypothetical protein
MYKELRRTLIPNNTGIGAPFTAVTDYYDPATRRPIAQEEDSQVNDPRELATGTEIDRFEVRPGLVHVVRYNGHGSVYTTSITSAAGPGNPSQNLTAIAQPSTTNTSAAGVPDASIDVTGHLGLPPYALKLTGTSGAAVGTVLTGTSPSEYYPYRFRNLPTGGYDAQVTDASGAVATVAVIILAGVGVPRGYDLHTTYTGDQQNGSGTRKIYVYNDGSLYEYQTPAGSGNDGDDYYTAYGFQLDAFLLDATTWRTVHADGQGGIYYVDAQLDTAAAGTLELHNIIWFDPDTALEQNGGILLEVNATALPVTFTLPRHGSNTTGSFDQLAAGIYPVTATDALGNTITVTVELKLRYGKRYELTYQEVGSPTLFRIELWTQDYDGEPETISGGAEVAVLESDALNTSLGGQGDLPSVVGTSLEATFRVPAGTFDDIDAGPQFYCRVDFYRNNKLEFRGFVIPSGLSESELQDGKLETSLTATDGLAQLKDVYFTGHQGQRLLGHRPWLNTVVHCLSRCKIALPLRFFTNRRDATMADSDAPETAATSNRTGYWKEGDDADPLFQREALNALAQALGGTLCQRGGAWEVRSPLEAAQDAPGRLYKPAGTYQGDAVALAPTGAVRPPRSGSWHWVERSQRKQVRASWKSLTGKTDVGYLKNAYIPGTVFSDPYAWVTDGSKLRAISGWKPAAGKTFPLVFIRVGDKQDKHATRWLRSATFSEADGNYLDGPLLPLVAGGESVPAFLSFTGRLAATETFSNPVTGSTYDSPTTGTKALLPYEIIVDGQSLGVQLAELKAGSSDATFTVELPRLLVGAKGALLRVGAWYAPDTLTLLLARNFAFGDGYKQGEAVKYQGKLYVARQEMKALGGGIGIAPGSITTAVYWAEITATDRATGQLLLSEIGVQLRPQGVTWDGADNVRVDSDTGTVRPTEVLDVFHADVPPAAGLYSGNLFAFGHGIGLRDGTMSTNWKRPSDLAPAPLFESAVLDIMALREGPSKLVPGTLATAGLEPPRLLDSVDLPNDLPGRRFLVGTRRWATKRGRVEVSLLEIGPGEGGDDDTPDGARATTNVVQLLPGQYVPELRLTEDGYIRVIE